MKLIYSTLNNNEEARRIGRKILEKNLANCVNFFPITCIYNYNSAISEESEVVLVIKTTDDTFEAIEQIIKSEITYDNFIGVLGVEKVNTNFEQWLTSIVK